MRTLIALAAVLAQSKPATETGDQYKPASQAEIDAVVAEYAKIDFATMMNEGAEATAVLLSPEMYLAIKSVETFRKGAQKKALTESERNLQNFDIMVTPGSKSTWLRAGEKPSHFQVSVLARWLPGEKVTLHGPRTLGRTVSYAVRKGDLKVTRFEFDSYQHQR